MKILLLASVLVTSEVFAWGATGHRAVGEIASEMLNASAGLKVHQILKGQSLARVSTWPDEIKSDPENYKYTYNWHYTDWPDEMHEHNETDSSGMLMGSIDEQLKTLKDPKATDEKKAFALKFLVHLIGDLHMPLHVGNGLDQGGNFCKVIFHNKQTNLHALWDDGMISFTGLSFTELAKFVRLGTTAEEVQSWKQGSPLDWALESKQLRATIYPQEPQTSYCRKETPVMEAEMPKLGYEYSYKFLPVVEKRLFQAGIRLAELLNKNL
ncbi:MAG TPA: S1/P1 nuclease [Bacteriovoracaceae bacterium]|nr:S1/P1 nuclease [Bacteriovoracaceae bacterium]